ncbi:hypothetical protein L2E82_17228 [Cichorium intybus]|uniref:Uncharacterized protein n=1 Tax=Cichorium intybus TaxID=13427 RepID=A0ACB9F8X8_CICIN|nr:hypothetical protein L2E82_17228 [Cichorium intybus]
MESLSRPFHRRKLSNANSFSGKNAYDGVFSGHRPKFDGVPAVNIDEYREIFSSGQAASSIPVLDLSTLQESSDGLSLELGSTKPDYGKIFGGFLDEDIAVSYEDLVARDKARVQDLGDDLSHESFDALKQFNMSYNKISKRSENGVDGTTHVTQLKAVPGFTFFIDESTSQKKETKKQKSSIQNKVNSPEKQTSHNSKVSSFPAVFINDEAAFQPKMETEKKKANETDNIHPVNSIKEDFHEGKTSQSAVEFKSEYHQEESLSDDKKIDLKLPNSKAATNGETKFQSKKETDEKKTSEIDDDFIVKQTSQSGVEFKSEYHQDDKKIDLKLHNFKAATNGEPKIQPKKETDKKKTSETDDDFLEKETSQSGVESRSKIGQDESLFDDGNFKKFEGDVNLHSTRTSSSSSSSSSSPATSATNVDDDHKDHKDYLKESSHGEFSFSSNCFHEELDVNSVAGASTAALRKAIEKAQESIRIAKESVGRKKEGLKSFSSKSFKDSLKVKVRVVNVRKDEEKKEKDNWINEIFKARVTNVTESQVFSEIRDGEKLFGAKKVINEIHEKIMESSENLEIPKESSHELKSENIDCDSKEVSEEKSCFEEVVCDSKEVGEEKRSCEKVENDTNESLKKDNERPNGFFVIENFENKVRDIEDTIKDDNKPIEMKENEDDVGPSNGYKLVEENSNLTLYQKVEDEKKVSQNGGYEKKLNESLGLLENTKQEAFEQEHSDDEASETIIEEERELKEDSDTGEKFYDVCEVEIIENSSSDYDDAEESDGVHVFHGVNRVVIDTQEVDKSDNNVETSQEVDDVSATSAQEDIKVINTEEKETEGINTEEKEILEKPKSDDELSKCDDEVSSSGLADVDIGQKEDKQEQEQEQEQCSNTILGMEIEVKEYQENKETIKKEEVKEEKPEIVTGINEEHESNKEVEKEVINEEEKERERNKLAVERAIREARERAFNEARERAERAAVEKATAEVRQRVQEKAAMKASDLITSKLKAERAAVERATSEARQRALEKAMSQKKVSEPRTQVNDVKQTSSSDLDVVNGTSVESALRSKAKMEKHNRIMERAAKALAEKEKRDQLAQKEQAERSRLSENLDADIKRWSTGKEGNLRALLSTLQYILGPESGWQSVSLTEIITTSAVKKAYRKATLCVHPDKLQQRGASIQQKYICEKVFDLLKAAWNRFNSEER